MGYEVGELAATKVRREHTVWCWGSENKLPWGTEAESETTKKTEMCFVSLVLLPPTPCAVMDDLTTVTSGVPCTL